MFVQLHHLVEHDEGETCMVDVVPPPGRPRTRSPARSLQDLDVQLRGVRVRVWPALVVWNCRPVPSRNTQQFSGEVGLGETQGGRIPPLTVCGLVCGCPRVLSGSGDAARCGRHTANLGRRDSKEEQVQRERAPRSDGVEMGKAPTTSGWVDAELDTVRRLWGWMIRREEWRRHHRRLWCWCSWQPEPRLATGCALVATKARVRAMHGRR